MAPRPIRTFQGRPLPRQDSELVDQGLAFDLATMNRRQVLRALGIGAAAVGLAACGDDGSPTSASPSAATSSTSTTSASPSAAATSASPSASGSAEPSSLEEIPDETAGPFPGDGSNGPDILETSGVVRSDIRESIGELSGTAEGVPMTLEMVVRDLANGAVPFAGVAVYIWHCDREAKYSMYERTDVNYLRGVQIADDEGRVSFTSVFPGCYRGRYPHIHFEVYPDEASIVDSTNALAVSQIALPQDACEEAYTAIGYEDSPANLADVPLSSDGIFGDGAMLQLPDVTGSVKQGYALKLVVGIDTRTATSSAGQGGGPGRPPR